MVGSVCFKERDKRIIHLRLICILYLVTVKPSDLNFSDLSFTQGQERELVGNKFVSKLAPEVGLASYTL